MGEARHRRHRRSAVTQPLSPGPSASGRRSRAAPPCAASRSRRWRREAVVMVRPRIATRARRTGAATLVSRRRTGSSAARRSLGALRRGSLRTGGMSGMRRRSASERTRRSHRLCRECQRQAEHQPRRHADQRRQRAAGDWPLGSFGDRFRTRRAARPAGANLAIGLEEVVQIRSSRAPRPAPGLPVSLNSIRLAPTASTPSASRSRAIRSLRGVSRRGRRQLPNPRSDPARRRCAAAPADR